MKTVQDYLDLGLVFVGDDELLSETNNKDSEGISISRCWLTHNGYDGFLEVADGFFANKGWTPSSFAWRNSDGVEPEYRGAVEILTKIDVYNGDTDSSIKNASDVDWRLHCCSHQVAKWRPVVLQSESPTISPKEYNPMKPVYAAEMHTKGELPPVGSECEALCMDATNSKHVWTKAKILMHHDGNECAVYCIDAGVLRWADEFKPIPKTIKVNGFDVPAPMSEAPEHRQMVYLAHSAHLDFNLDFTWQGDDAAASWLSRGLIHKTESAAIAHAKAMLGINPNA